MLFLVEYYAITLSQFTSVFDADLSTTQHTRIGFQRQSALGNENPSLISCAPGPISQSKIPALRAGKAFLGQLHFYLGPMPRCW